MFDISEPSRQSSLAGCEVHTPFSLVDPCVFFIAVCLAIMVYSIVKIAFSLLSSQRTEESATEDHTNLHAIFKTPYSLRPWRRNIWANLPRPTPQHPLTPFQRL
jgi:hypothetical protein